MSQPEIISYNRKLSQLIKDVRKMSRAMSVAKDSCKGMTFPGFPDRTTPSFRVVAVAPKWTCGITCSLHTTDPRSVAEWLEDIEEAGYIRRDVDENVNLKTITHTFRPEEQQRS